MIKDIIVKVAKTAPATRRQTASPRRNRPGATRVASALLVAVQGLVKAGAEPNVAILNPPASGCVASGLAGCWHFDEGSGASATDSSGNANTGAETSCVYISGTVGSHALAFTGGSTVQVPNAASLQLTGDVTITCWINPTNVTSVAVAMEKGTDSANNCSYGFGWPATGVLNFIHGNNFDASSGYVLTNGWQHLAMVRATNGATITYFVNGARLGSVAYTISPAANTSALGIGSRGAGTAGNAMNGALDDVRIYNRQLGAAEISAIFNNTNSCP